VSSNDDPFDWRPLRDTPGFIAEMPHTVAFLLADQTYRGRTVVWLKEHFDDPADVPRELRTLLMDEVMYVAEAIRRALRPDRLNYTCFGNAVPHVHWHIIPRRKDDPDWGKAPWRENERTGVPEAEITALAARIRKELEPQLTED
jgi:diadenosine tetraphosphate (Ap4A) HIT family hydrolase